eukprot:2941835-Prymnesium_polylepis.1
MAAVATAAATAAAAAEMAAAAAVMAGTVAWVETATTGRAAVQARSAARAAGWQRREKLRTRGARRGGRWGCGQVRRSCAPTSGRRLACTLCAHGQRARTRVVEVDEAVVGIDVAEHLGAPRRVECRVEGANAVGVVARGRQHQVVHLAAPDAVGRRVVEELAFDECAEDDAIAVGDEHGRRQRREAWTTDGRRKWWRRQRWRCC